MSNTVSNQPKKGLKRIDKSYLPSKYKIWCFQFTLQQAPKHQELVGRTQQGRRGLGWRGLWSKGLWSLVQSIDRGEEEFGCHRSDKAGGRQALCKDNQPMPVGPMDKVGGHSPKVCRIERPLEDAPCLNQVVRTSSLWWRKLEEGHGGVWRVHANLTERLCLKGTQNLLAVSLPPCCSSSHIRVIGLLRGLEKWPNK